MRSAVTSGTSPDRTTTGRVGVQLARPRRERRRRCRGARSCTSERDAIGQRRRRARGRGRRPRRPSRRRPRARPRRGHATSGRPHRSCSTLGVAERMRVPSPAAMITTVGTATRRIVAAMSRRRTSARAGVARGRTVHAAKRGRWYRRRRHWGAVKLEYVGLWSLNSRSESGLPSCRCRRFDRHDLTGDSSKVDANICSTSGPRPSFTETEARAAIGMSRSWAEGPAKSRLHADRRESENAQEVRSVLADSHRSF